MDDLFNSHVFPDESWRDLDSIYSLATSQPTFGNVFPLSTAQWRKWMCLEASVTTDV